MASGYICPLARSMAETEEEGRVEVREEDLLRVAQREKVEREVQMEEAAEC